MVLLLSTFLFSLSLWLLSVASIFPNVGEYVFVPKAQPKAPGAAFGSQTSSTSYFSRSTQEEDVSQYSIMMKQKLL